ncbi:MAG: acyltransferase family protein, partial [Betaproteobacteria bacterium]
ALMRGAAALLVIYDHLVGMWLQRNAVVWKPAVMADRWFFDPLHIMMHGGGLAVALFFMVSGFVIVYVAQRETRREFVIRRALRIFPPLWMSIVLLLLAYTAVLAFSTAPALRAYAVSEVLAKPNPAPYILAAMTLSNYLVGTPPINGVAWTLIIEVLFYLHVALLLPLFQKRAHLAIVIAFGFLLFVQIFARVHWMFFLLAVNLTYVTFLFLGSLVYLRWADRIGNRFFAVASLAFAVLFLRGIRDIVLQPPFTLSEYGVSYAYAWICFVVLLLLDSRIRLGRIMEFFSRISYSLYLNHGGLGLLALTLLYPWTGYPLGLLLALVAVVAVSAASWRWVELPSQRLARRWTGKSV